MINQQTKELILETSRIEEVVGDFVALKKRGANLLGLCPFHNEKTPSFTVSPAKGFFKCFGCGKAGDSVTFIMEHEHLTFPESLKYLAAKYKIEVEEDVPSADAIEERNQRESLFIVSAFAQRYYTSQLWETEEGKAVGLSYFRERGFTDEIINRFQLGYSTEQWNALTIAALSEGYQLEYLEKAGLTVNSDGKQFDRFRGRVMFPIHNLTGRVIAFGARILKTDAKAAKYLNSPETEIYHKSNVLYGISFAKKAIIQQDECFLVEGYTDVLALHQAGIENVVASSGTSLTVEQIRLIGRYSKNVTVLYDGDAAGIKASLRGIDLILEEGLSVRVLLFPDGDDPDSFSRKVSTDELKEYIKKNTVDFIGFKTKLLLAEVANDPIKKAGLIRDIVESIAKVPDVIQRATYIKQTSALMEISESVLLQEMSRILRKSVSKHPPEFIPAEEEMKQMEAAIDQEERNAEEFSTIPQEEEIIRILLLYGDRPFAIPLMDGSAEENIEVVPVFRFIVGELLSDGIKFTRPEYAALFADFTTMLENSAVYNVQQFVQNLNSDIKPAAISLLTPRHELSDWESHGVAVKTEQGANFNKAIIDPVMYLKKKQLMKMRKDNQQTLSEREKAGQPYDDLLEKEKTFQAIQSEINRFTGNTVIQK
jgi:DNA primase